MLPAIAAPKLQGPDAAGALAVPVSMVTAALADAARPTPAWVDPIVARAVSTGQPRTRRARLERLARAVHSAAPVADPADVWRMDWSRLDVPAVEQIDRGIAAGWPAASSRNAMRDSVRSVIKAGWARGEYTAEKRDRLLAAIPVERQPVDTGRQTRGHIPSDRVAAAFRVLAADPSPIARRDAAILALLVGCGLRRAELVALDLEHLAGDGDMLVVAGKGGKTRDVPLPAGVRRALAEWMTVRGDAPGPLIQPLTHTTDRAPTGRRMTVEAVWHAVRRMLGDGVAPHDLRRTAVGDLLDSGADLSIVSAIVGHRNPQTTARYDRRGLRAAQAAMDRLQVPFAPSDRQAQR